MTGRSCVLPAYDLGSGFVSFKGEGGISPRGHVKVASAVCQNISRRWWARKGGVCRASIAHTPNVVQNRRGGKGGYIGKRGGGGMGAGEAGGPGVIISPGIRSRLGGNGSGCQVGRGIQRMTLLVLPTAQAPDGPVRGNESDPARSQRGSLRRSPRSPEYRYSHRRCQASWVPCTRAEQTRCPVTPTPMERARRELSTLPLVAFGEAMLRHLGSLPAPLRESTHSRHSPWSTRPSRAATKSWNYIL